MADRTLFCAICSGPIRPLAPGPGQEWSAALKWQTKLILLSDPDREFETLEQHYKAGKRPKIPKLAFQAQADIRRDVAVVRDGEWCVLQDADGTEIKPNWSMEVDENNRVYSMPYSIAAHGACVDIVVRLMRSSRNEVHVRSMRTLWKVLRMGFDARDNEYMGSVDAAGPQYIVMDNGHYMPVGFVTAPGAWNGDDEHWVVSDPSRMPDLTSDIISNLEKLHSDDADPDIQEFRGQFLALSYELRDKIVSFMGSPSGLSTHCTRWLPQEVWRDILLENKYLPFLWDLDHDMLFNHSKEAAQAGINLDWELLVRKLSQGVEWSQRPQNGSGELEPMLECYPDLRIPNGLRNRRRIWQLVEEMFVGDVLPVARPWTHGTQVPCMPRYWDEYGDPVYPVFRLAGLGSSV